MTSCDQEPRFVSHCLDHENEETCRKKRCADRYDSSESSDSGVVTSVSEDAFSTTNSDCLDLDSPRSHETLDSNEDSFTHQDHHMAPSHTALDKAWRKSWPEDPSGFLAPDDGMDEGPEEGNYNALSQYLNHLRGTNNKLDFFSNDSDFLGFLNSSCASSSKSDSGIGTEESSESSQSSARLSTEPDDLNLSSKPPSTCSTPRPDDNAAKIGFPEESGKVGSPEQSSRIRFPATRNSSLSNSYVPPKNYVCKWKDCTAKFSIISNLVHHVQTVHVITQRHLGHFTCLWENCRHYEISYNCAPSWPDHHVLSHTGKTFECFIPGCKRIFKTEVLQRRHITHHLDIISTQSTNSQSKHRDSLVTKSARKTNKRLKQRRIPYSANKPDYFDRTVMEDLAKRLQIFERCSQGIIEYNHDMSVSVCLQNKVVATRTLLNGVREKLVRYYPPFIVDEEWIPLSDSIDRSKKFAWNSISDTGKLYVFKFLRTRQRLLHENNTTTPVTTESKTTSSPSSHVKTETKKVLLQCERNNNSVPSNQNLIVKRITRAKTARKVK